jgi:hypothetical protein
MFKKPIMSCVVLAAFVVFVLPATASATNNPDLTEGATRVPVGTLIQATNIGNAEFVATDGTTTILGCPRVNLTGKVTANSGGTFEGSITKAEFSGTGAVHAHNNLPECTGSFGNLYLTIPNLPLTISSTPAMTTDEARITDSSGSTVTFTFGSTTSGACTYKSASSIKVDFTTGATSVVTTRNTATGSGLSKVSGGFLCVSSMQLKMSFYLETDAAGNAELGIS